MPGLHIPSKGRRPTVSAGSSGIRKFRPIGLPSIVDSMGRNTVCNFSRADGELLVGADVAGPQKYSFAEHTFHNYSAGGAADGTKLNSAYKKTVGLLQGPDYTMWLSGSNGNGGAFCRELDADHWTLVNDSICGAVDDGASADPRRVGSRVIEIDGDNVWIAGERKSDNRGGIARGVRSVPSSGNVDTWNNSYLFDQEREVTGIKKSPQWNVLYMTSGFRTATTASEGLFILTNITSASPTVTKIDNTGTGDARDGGVLVDVRDLFVCRVSGNDHIYIVVGNASQADNNRGIWRCIVSHDPTDGGFNAATHVNWDFTYLNPISERMNTICGYQPNGANTSPVHLQGGYFKPNFTISGGGSWNLSAAAGGGSQAYKEAVVRVMNADGGSPTAAAISMSSTIHMEVFGQRPAHTWVLGYSGQASNEKGRMGGTAFSATGMDASTDGKYVVVSGKSGSWIATNPWTAIVTDIDWYPIVRGFGALGGEFTIYYARDKSLKIAFSEDDWGVTTFNSTAEPWSDSPDWNMVWVGVDALDGLGVIAGRKQCRGVAESVITPGILTIGHQDGRGFLITNPFDFETAVASLDVDYTSAGATGECLRHIDFKDNLNKNVKIGFCQLGIFREYDGGGGGGGNIPVPREVNTSEEAAARIAGYIFGDGNPESPDGPLGGDAMTTIATSQFQTECIRCAGIIGWVSGTHYRVTGGGNFRVLKSALCGALGIPTSDDIYHHALTDSTPTRLQCQAFLASVIETEGQAGTAPSCKIFDDARGGIYDQRIDKLRDMMNFSGVGPTGSTRVGTSTRVPDANLSSYPIPLINDSRYPGTSLADWPEGGGGGGGGGGTISRVQTLSSTSSRMDYMKSTTNPGTLFAHYPDLGIYRSQDYGATWSVFRNKTVPSASIIYHGHSELDMTNNVMWSSFEDGGVWKTTGINGSPTNTLTVGGSISAGSIITGLTVDPIRLDVWVIEVFPDGSGAAKLHYLPGGTGSTWVEWEDTEFSEGAASTLEMISHDGYLFASTLGQGTLRLWS